MYIVDSYKFNSLNPSTIAYKARVEADGGEIIDIDWVDIIYNTWDTYTIEPSVICAHSLNAGVKKDGSDRISKVYDLGTHDEDLVQTTGANQPLLTGGLNGRKKMLTDGVSDKMDQLTLVATYPQPVTHYLIWEPQDVSSNQRVYPVDSGSPRNLMDVLGSSKKLRLYSGAFGTHNSLLLVDGTAYITRMLFSGASSRVRLNGGSDITPAPHPGTEAFDKTGIANGGSYAAVQDIYDCFSYDGDLSSAASNALRDMWNTYYSAY